MKSIIYWRNLIGRRVKKRERNRRKTERGKGASYHEQPTLICSSWTLNRVPNLYLDNSWHLEQFVCSGKERVMQDANRLRGEGTPLLGLWAYFPDKAEHSWWDPKQIATAVFQSKLWLQRKVHQRHHLLITALNLYVYTKPWDQFILPFSVEFICLRYFRF